MQKVYVHCKLSNLGELNDSITKELSKHFTLFEFDKQLRDEYLPWTFKEAEPTVLVIPAILDSSNTLGYDGLEFALHWYFKLIQSNKEFALCIVGFEEKSAFFEHCDYSNFIKCPNVFYIEFSIENIQFFINQVQPELFPAKDYIESLRKVGIKPPASHKTHHSITNEWSVYRWSKFLGIKSFIQENLAEEIKSSLYYNYLQTIYPITKTEQKQLHLKNTGKVLLIDDEADKGWAEFFSELMNSQPYSFLGSEFKQTVSKKEIIDACIKKVQTFDPDVVILDLRLHDDDFEYQKPEEFTGYSVLKEIKKYNQGVQVLIFTASNKIYNYLALHDHVNGFILKESPDLSIDEYFTENAVVSLVNNIDKCLRDKYLKEVFLNTRILKNTKLQTAKSDNNKFRELKQTIRQNLETAFILSQQSSTIEFALFTYLQVLESYCKYFTFLFKDDGKAVVLKDPLKRSEEDNQWVIFETQRDEIISNYKYQKDFYPFQRYRKDEKDKQFVNYVNEKVVYGKNDLKFSFSLKLASVLDVHIKDMNSLPDLMELIFIRNNKIAHISENFDESQRQITSKDILVVFRTIKYLINNSF